MHKTSGRNIVDLKTQPAKPKKSERLFKDNKLKRDLNEFSCSLFFFALSLLFPVSMTLNLSSAQPQNDFQFFLSLLSLN